MRFFKGMVGLLAGTGLSLTGAILLVGCGKNFNGCEASRSCKSSTGGDSGMPGDETPGGAAAGEGGSGGSAGASSGAKGGAAGKGGSSGRGGKSGSANAGASGEGEGARTSGTDEGGASGGGGTPSAESKAGEGGMQGAGASDSGVDSDAPHILSTVPANGDKGVQSDVEITVTFSEPMDNASTEAAYQSVDLPLDGVSLYWKNNDTVLVIHPKEPLVYADVDDPSADAKHYSFTIAGTATDVAGNALGDERTFVFTTLRHITHELTIQKRFGRNVNRPADGSADQNDIVCWGVGNHMCAGDGDDDEARAFAVAFSLDSVPDGVVQWDSATLSGTIEPNTAGNPFSRFGGLEAYSVAVDDVGDVTWGTPPRMALGAVSNSIHTTDFKLDVLDAVTADYSAVEDQNYLSTTFFRFETPTNDDGEAQNVVVGCDMVLDLAYTAP